VEILCATCHSVPPVSNIEHIAEECIGIFMGQSTRPFVPHFGAEAMALHIGVSLLTGRKRCFIISLIKDIIKHDR
jgi:hypothetical protein